jgi:hypothetical protein
MSVTCCNYLEAIEKIEKAVRLFVSVALADQRPAAGAAVAGKSARPTQFSFYCSDTTTDGCRFVGDSSMWNTVLPFVTDTTPPPNRPVPLELTE